MSITRRPRDTDSGDEQVLSAEQIGVEYPDGKIIWSDIEMGVVVDNQTIQTFDGKRYLFNSNVDIVRRERDMNVQFEAQCALTHVPFSPLVLVKRRILLALDRAVPMI